MEVLKKAPEMKLIVVVGDYGSGKTTFARRYAKENKIAYCDYDKLRRPLSDLGSFLQKFTKFARKCKKDTIILDGWYYFLTPVQAFPIYSVSYCLCIAAPCVIRARKTKKNIALPEPSFVIAKVESKYNLVCDREDTIYIDTTNGTALLTREEARALLDHYNYLMLKESSCWVSMI